MGIVSSLTSSSGLVFVAGLGIGVAVGFTGAYLQIKYLNNDDDDDEWEDEDSDDDESTDDDLEEEEEEEVISKKPLRVKGPVKMVLVVRQDLKMGKGKIEIFK